VSHTYPLTLSRQPYLGLLPYLVRNRLKLISRDGPSPFVSSESSGTPRHGLTRPAGPAASTVRSRPVWWVRIGPPAVVQPVWWVRLVRAFGEPILSKRKPDWSRVSVARHALVPLLTGLVGLELMGTDHFTVSIRFRTMLLSAYQGSKMADVLLRVRAVDRRLGIRTGPRE
jgi:hypothetical protein